jgi:hypothetical protein
MQLFIKQHLLQVAGLQQDTPIPSSSPLFAVADNKAITDAIFNELLDNSICEARDATDRKKSIATRLNSVSPRSPNARFDAVSPKSRKLKVTSFYSF